MVDVSCKRMKNIYICDINGKTYRFNEIYMNGDKITADKFYMDVEKLNFRDGILNLEKNHENGLREDIAFLKKYYKKSLPTLKDIEKKKKIMSKYNTPEEKQKIYLEIIGGRPNKSICLYDSFPEDYFEKMGFSPKINKKEPYEFIKHKKGNSIVIMVKPKNDKYFVDYIRVYDKKGNFQSPICVLPDGRWIDIGGEIHE